MADIKLLLQNYGSGNQEDEQDDDGKISVCFFL